MIECTRHPHLPHHALIDREEYITELKVVWRVEVASFVFNPAKVTAGLFGLFFGEGPVLVDPVFQDVDEFVGWDGFQSSSFTVRGV